jgi:hypothetical protein
MKKKVVFCAFALLFCACGTIQYVPVETIKTEYRDRIVRDSVFRHDSIYVREKGDTVFLERYSYLYMDKIVRDSVFMNDTIRVPYPVEVIKEVKKPLTGWQNFQVWCGRIALIVALLFAVYFVWKRR